MHFSSVLLPLPLRPTIPKNSPGGDLERDVLDGVQLVVVGAAERVQRALLERRVLLVGQAEGLADALDRDGGGAARAVGAGIEGEASGVATVDKGR